MDCRKRTVMKAIGCTRRAWLCHTKAIAMELGISDSYREIIVFLDRHPGANQKNIAEFCNVTTAAVNQTLKDMLADGYVEKETDEADRRYTKLFLTEKGQETAVRILERLRVVDEKITEAITPEKAEEMIWLLDKIRDLLREETGK